MSRSIKENTRLFDSLFFYEAISEQKSKPLGGISYDETEITKAIKETEKLLEELRTYQRAIETYCVDGVKNNILERVRSFSDSSWMRVMELMKAHTPYVRQTPFRTLSETRMPPLSITKDKDGVFRIVLPPFYSKQQKIKFTEDGKLFAEVVRQLAKEYEERTGIHLTPAYSTVVITVDNYFSSIEVSTPDTDNIDFKSTLDALQGILLPGDSAAVIKEIDIKVHESKKDYAVVSIAPWRDEKCSPEGNL